MQQQWFISVHVYLPGLFCFGGTLDNNVMCSAATAVIGRVSVFCDTGANASVNPANLYLCSRCSFYILFHSYIYRGRSSGAIKEPDGSDTGTAAVGHATSATRMLSQAKQSGGCGEAGGSEGRRN